MITRPPAVNYTYHSAPSNVLLYWKVQPLELPLKPAWGWHLCGNGLGEAMEYAWAAWHTWSRNWCPGPCSLLCTRCLQALLEASQGGRENGTWGITVPCGSALWALQTHLQVPCSPLGASAAPCLGPWQALRMSVSSMHLGGSVLWGQTGVLRELAHFLRISCWTGILSCSASPRSNS